MLTLYGCQGTGSAAIEALLELTGEPFNAVLWAWEDPAGWAALAPINPLKQVPTLVTEDGHVMTESVAMALWLMDRHPASTLVPPVNSPARMDFYRWFVYIAVNIYGPIGIGDFPERWTDSAGTDALKKGMLERLKLHWSIMEAAITPAPFLLGPAMSALDVYVAMITRWRPGRPWFDEHCPKIMSAVRATEADPRVVPAWQRNFGTQ